MKRLFFLTFLLSTLGFAQTAEDLVSKAISARGGLDKIKSVQTLRMQGTISFGGGDSGKLIAEWKRPGKFRQELVMNGKTMLRATNGHEGWSLNPFAGDAAPRDLSAEEMSLIAEQADFDKPLIDYKAKGNTVELVGKEQVEGKDTYKIKVTLKNGAVRYENIDVSSFLESRWNGKLTNEDKEVEFDTYFRDYKAVNSLQFPFTIDTKTVGSEVRQKIVFDKIEVNPALNDDQFEKPPAPPPASPK
ncbi:MAG TPA: hypothetical protein VFA68_15905 [Terriglobales bacterium]|nr:hypothetical protein [Terriglobales bacterium]